jgi:hypothetical protein
MKKNEYDLAARDKHDKAILKHVENMESASTKRTETARRYVEDNDMSDLLYQDGEMGKAKEEASEPKEANEKANEIGDKSDSSEEGVVTG